MRYLFIILLGMAVSWGQGHAQNEKEDGPEGDFEAFRQSVYQDFYSFRRQCMEEFIAFMRNPWTEFENVLPIPFPKETPKPPVVMPEEDRYKPLRDKPVEVDTVIPPLKPHPRPQPVSPVEEVPGQDALQRVDFTLWGTGASVRFDDAARIALKGVDNQSVADGLARMTATGLDATLADCLELRDRLQLCDWAYLRMLQKLSETVFGTGRNEAVLLAACLYMQSGYKMRLGSDGTKLYLLFASKHQIFNATSYSIDNATYYGIDKLPERLMVCNVAFPQEKELSLFIDKPLLLKPAYADTVRTHRSAAYPDVAVTARVNQNLMEFYNTYPVSIYNGEIMTKWAVYAQTPLHEDVREQVMPALDKSVKGMSEREAVSRLLNLVQTGFEYEYDEKVWGHDRPFFAEETLYYPFCDCEDRAILLSRLVRDLLGLRTLLVFYPGHLAMAVAFNEKVEGDYIVCQGLRFVVCDPTYIGAPVGATMTGMDNAKATVVLLEP